MYLLESADIEISEELFQKACGLDQIVRFDAFKEVKVIVKGAESIRNLKDEARMLGIRNFSRMNKTQLEEGIRDARANLSDIRLREGYI